MPTPQLTKKDFFAIAEVLNDYIRTSSAGIANGGTMRDVILNDGHARNLVDSFARFLARTNPRFQEARFLEAAYFGITSQARDRQRGGDACPMPHCRQSLDANLAMNPMSRYAPVYICSAHSIAS